MGASAPVAPLGLDFYPDHLEVLILVCVMEVLKSR
jgi:hypothetical protein